MSYNIVHFYILTCKRDIYCIRKRVQNNKKKPDMLCDVLVIIIKLYICFNDAFKNQNIVYYLENKLKLNIARK